MVNEEEFFELIDALSTKIGEAIAQVKDEKPQLASEDVLIATIEISATFAILSRLPKEIYLDGCASIYDKHMSSMKEKLND